MTPSFSVRADAIVNAPAARVYGIIADYRTGHPRILPREFSDLTVEQGGVGAGTIIHFNVTVLGQTQKFRAFVTEPQPGRVLMEENVQPSPSVSTFTVDPLDARRTRVTIETRMSPTRGGLAGKIEQFLSKRVLRSIYTRELRLLDAVARADS